MVHSNVFIVLAIALFVCVSANVVPDTKKTEPFAEVQDLFKDFHDNVLNIFGVQNHEDLNKKFQEGGHKFIDAINDWVETTRKETDKLGESKAVQDFKNTLNTAITDLKTENPDLNAYVEKTKNVTHDVIKKLKDLSVDEDIKKFSDTVLKTAGDAFQKVADAVPTKTT